MASVRSPRFDVSLDPGIWNQKDSPVMHLLCSHECASPFRDSEQRKSPAFGGYGGYEMGNTTSASVTIQLSLPRMVSVYTCGPGVFLNNTPFHFLDDK